MARTKHLSSAHVVTLVGWVGHEEQLALDQVATKRPGSHIVERVNKCIQVAQCKRSRLAGLLFVNGKHACCLTFAPLEFRVSDSSGYQENSGLFLHLLNGNPAGFSEKPDPVTCLLTNDDLPLSFVPKNNSIVVRSSPYRKNVKNYLPLRVPRLCLSSDLLCTVTIDQGLVKVLVT